MKNTQYHFKIFKNEVKQRKTHYAEKLEQALLPFEVM